MRGKAAQATPVEPVWSIILAVLRLYGFLSRSTGLSGREEPVAVVSVLLVLTFSFFHGVVHLDYDGCYRVPAIPQLIFLAGIGLATVQHRLMGTQGASGAASADLPPTPP